MIPPSGEQFEIAAGGYRAVVTESGAALRELTYQGRPLLDGFGSDEQAGGGRGQVLIPWPNRIRDGRYDFDGRSQVLGLTDRAYGNASHGLVRWAAWTLEEHTPVSVSLIYRLMAQTGYPWSLELRMVYDLSADGLTVTHSATNLSAERAPYAAGMHPYLSAGPGPIDGWELTLPASQRVLVDERQLPAGSESVDGTPYDFRISRPIRETVFDHPFTGLERDEEARATVELRDPATGLGVALWVDGLHDWLQVFSEPSARRSLAVEPMTAPPDAFNSGTGLVVLDPADSEGDEFTACWGIRALL